MKKFHSRQYNDNLHYPNQENENDTVTEGEINLNRFPIEVREYLKQKYDSSYQSELLNNLSSLGILKLKRKAAILQWLQKENAGNQV